MVHFMSPEMITGTTTPHTVITSQEIKDFRNDPLIKSLYQFVDQFNLRKSAIIIIQKHLALKENMAQFEDL